VGIEAVKAWGLAFLEKQQQGYAERKLAAEKAQEEEAAFPGAAGGRGGGAGRAGGHGGGGRGRRRRGAAPAAGQGELPAGGPGGEGAAQGGAGEGPGGARGRAPGPRGAEDRPRQQKEQRKETAAPSPPRCWRGAAAAAGPALAPVGQRRPGLASPSPSPHRPLQPSSPPLPRSCCSRRRRRRAGCRPSSSRWAPCPAAPAAGGGAALVSKIAPLEVSLAGGDRRPRWDGPAGLERRGRRARSPRRAPLAGPRWPRWAPARWPACR